jgi:ankyrin repeat protein
MTAWLLFLVLILAGQGPAANTAADSALLDAAQQNDLPGVTRALQQGANVNAKTRYSATALMLGAMNGNLEMVRLLAERGADLNVRDTFYSFTPMGAAMLNGRVDVIRYLIEKGSPGAPDALPLAIQRTDIPLLSAALASKEIPDRIVAATHALAVKNGNKEMAAAARSAMTARSIAPDLIVSVSPASLQPFAGTYVGPAGQALTVNLKDDQLLVVQGPATAVLFPTSETTFVSPQRPLAELTFERKGDTVERLTTRQGQQTLQLTRTSNSGVAATTAAPAPAPPGAVAARPTAADFAVAPRGTARPWPSFRGANASGAADGQGAVAEWDTASQKNIRWKTPVPGISTASPVVWGNRVYIATAVSSAGNNTFRTGLYGDTFPVNYLS